MSDKIKDISILLVEDETELSEYLKEYLEMFFYRVYNAPNGDIAYDIYKQKRPDIILTDINMPHMNGFNLVSKIRKNDNKTKIIIMSAHSEQDKLLQAIKLNLVTYLIKPIQNDILKKILLDTVKLIRYTEKRLYLSENIFWDIDTDTLWKKNQLINIKDKEKKLIKLLCSKPNHAFSAKEIFDYINKEKKTFSQHAVTSLMKRLRIKLPEDFILNIYGSGYKVVAY
ncbi:MAG: transcriptional regulator [Sulfurimonas sp.]|nr:MAG: transcriptional regulator [Sulfurimonas sp.]